MSLVTGYALKKAGQSISKTQPFSKLLNELGIKQLNNTFDSIYKHALVQYAVDRDPVELVAFFDLPAVRQAFQKDQHNNDPATFQRCLTDQLHTNANVRALKRHYSSVTELAAEITAFKQFFHAFSIQASNPLIRQLFNEQRKSNLEKSFTYQAKQYLKKEKEEFAQRFLDNHKYVPLIAEKRHYTRHVDYPLHHAPPKTMGRMEETEEDYTTTIYNPIDQYVNQWLAQEQNQLLILIGEYGTGKTTFAQYLTHQLASQYIDPTTTTHIRDPKQRLVLYLPLRNFEKKLDTFIITQLVNYCFIDDAPYPNVQKRNKQGELVLILDGFDEMTNNMDTVEKQRNFAKLLPLIDAPNSKVVLTCRSEYFKDRADRAKVFKAGFQDQSKWQYEMLYLRPWTDAQIQQFLKHHTEQPEVAWKQITQIKGLNDLAQRPVLLELLVRYLPQLIRQQVAGQAIKASDLYQSCLDEELRRKEMDMEHKRQGKDRLSLLQEVAAWLYAQDQLTFDIAQLINDLDLKTYFKTQTQTQTQTELEFERHLNEFLSFTFLIRDSNDQFRISHKSFRDYLTAKAWAEGLQQGDDRLFCATKLTNEVLDFLVEQPIDQAFLQRLLLTAKDLTEDRQWQGTNAVRLLLRLDKNGLVGQNLANVVFREVNFDDVCFDDAVLYQTVFKACSLNHSIFEAATIQQCDFEGSSLNVPWRSLNSKIKAHLPKFNQIHRLDLAGNEIETIDFLTTFTQLKELSLFNNKLENIQPIQQLTQLKALSLSYNKLENIQPIQQLIHLETLSLSNNKLENIQPIQQLTQLKELYLSYNKLENIQPIQQLTQLKALSLDNNKLENIQPIQQLTQLKKLNLSNNKLENIQPIQQLTQLKALSLDNNKLENIQPIQQLTQLKELYLSNNKLENIQPIQQLTQLKALSLDNNKLENIQPIQQLTQLKELYLSNNKLENIQPIQQLTQLKALSLDNNKLENIQPIQQLIQLKILSLNNNKLENIQLQKLTQLKGLGLTDNPIQSITLIDLKQLEILKLPKKTIQYINLQHLQQLTHLNLSHQTIQSIAFTGLDQLKVLNLRETSLPNLSFLTNLPALETLIISEPKALSIIDQHCPHLKGLLVAATLPSIQVILAFPQLTELGLKNIPLSDIPLLQQLPHLETIAFQEPLSEDQQLALRQAIPNVAIEIWEEED